MSQRQTDDEMTRIWVDFNGEDEQGLYPTLQQYADDPVGVGQRVVAYDHDGNRADGAVAAVDGAVVLLRIDLSTFVDAHDLTAAAS